MRHNGSASRVSVFQSVKAVHLIVMQMKLLSVSCVEEGRLSWFSCLSS